MYLARVINIPAVQCHRAAATDDSIEKLLFFDAGCRPGLPGHFQWNLDTWDAFPPGAFRLGHNSRFGPYATRVVRGGRGL